MMNNKYKCIPFWSWNDALDEQELIKQIDWMHSHGVGGFFMHARGGLLTPYLGKKWFSCIKACAKHAQELKMEAYAYDENGWPSGFVGGKLLEDKNNRDNYLTFTIGEYDCKSYVSYSLNDEKLSIVKSGDNCLNVYLKQSNSTVDILNPKVVRKFIKLTHEKYLKNDPEHLLKGFFTDEPQYYRWGHPFTKCLISYFKQHYHQDILEGLGLLFVEKEGYRDFRYKYWKAMQDLMLNSYSKQIYDWCDKYNYQFTGHYIEESSLRGQMMCCAGIMPFYEYEHIPGIDWLGRRILPDIASKQVGSVAAQLGKKQVLTETFAMVGWDATPEELKHIAESQYVNGVNLMCTHLLPYSEYGQRKRDYPEHFSKHNPWVEKHFQEFNDYFSNLGEKLSNSQEIVNVGVIHPIRSCYFDYKFDDKVRSLEAISNPFDELLATLNKEHIPYHFIDETLLAKYGKVQNQSLSLGLCHYDYIILPKMWTMDKTTYELLLLYVKQGGKILLVDQKSLQYVEGKKRCFNDWTSNCSFKDIKNSLPFSISDNENVRLCIRKDKNNKTFLYLVNLGEETHLEINKKIITFKKWESKLLYLSDLEYENNAPIHYISLKDQFSIQGHPLNYLTLDNLAISRDGVNYSPIKYHMAIFDSLLKKRYKGPLFLKYSFDVKNIPGSCYVLTENNNLLSLKINNHRVKDYESVLEKNLLRFNISPFVTKGRNDIVIKINYHQSDDVYYALFGKNVTESLRNCLVYKTTIESIYLQGDFGVYGTFNQVQDDAFVGHDFYLDVPQKQICSLIQDGYPFFRGDITLTQEINVDETKGAILYIPERFQAMDVYINDHFAGLMMFSHYLDVSQYVKKGSNKIKLVLTVSNRNLLGPSHSSYSYECLGVAPATFEMFGSWKGNKNEKYREDYSFVKTII